MFNKMFVNFATTSEGPTTKELKDSIEKFVNNDNNKSAFPTNLSEGFKTVSNLKKNEAGGKMVCQLKCSKLSFR